MEPFFIFLIVLGFFILSPFVFSSGNCSSLSEEEGGGRGWDNQHGGGSGGG
jgi:hypothetical protein